MHKRNRGKDESQAVAKRPKAKKRKRKERPSDIVRRAFKLNGGYTPAKPGQKKRFRERFVLGKDTLRFNSREHFVLRIINVAISLRLVKIQRSKAVNVYTYDFRVPIFLGYKIVVESISCANSDSYICTPRLYTHVHRLQKSVYIFVRFFVHFYTQSDAK